MSGSKWTEQQVDILSMFYPAFGSRFVAKRTGKTKGAVHGKALAMGIRCFVRMSTTGAYRPYSPCVICGVRNINRGVSGHRQTCGDKRCKQAYNLHKKKRSRNGSLAEFGPPGSLRLLRLRGMPDYDILRHFTKPSCDWCHGPLKDNRVAHHNHDTGKYEATVHTDCNTIEGFAKKIGQDRFAQLSQSLLGGGPPEAYGDN